MSESVPLEFHLKHKLCFAVLIPVILLICIEVVFRIFKIEKLISPDTQVVNLDMPTWMLKDQNQIIKDRNMNQERGKIDWFNIFEEGEGYRVRLVPDIERNVSNTFSLIEYDRKQKYYIKANSIGFRGAEISKVKPTNTFRILIFGDSSSFGWGVDQNDTFYYILKDKLSKLFPDKNIEIGNFAIPGDSSEYGKLIVEKFLPQYDPDLVIFGFGANDAKLTYIRHSQQVDQFKANSFSQNIRFYASYSSLYRSLESLFKPKSGKPAKLQKTNAVSTGRYTKNLKYMSSLSKDQNAQVLILNLCTPGDYAAYAKKLAEKKKINYLNGQSYLVEKIPEIKNKSLYPDIVNNMEAHYRNELSNDDTLYITSDGCHPNQLGHRIIADKMTEIISTLIK